MSKRDAAPPSASDAVTIDGAAVERFRRDWTALTGAASGERALVALSGGPDSCGLLLLVRAVLGPSCHAATVDHGLRAAARAEADAAAALCASLGVDHRTLRDALPERTGGSANISARARTLRYALLDAHAERLGARWIVTAHHADDQRETVVMRLNRGSGIAGLAAIRAVEGKVVRPLLRWRRGELAAICSAAEVATVDDPSNFDERYDRARIRKALTEAPWLDVSAVARSAALLGEAETALAWTADRLAHDRCQTADHETMLDPTGLPAELLRRLTLRCLRRIDPGCSPRGAELSRLIEAMQEGRTAATLGHVRVHRTRVGDPPRQQWHFRAAPPRRTR